MCARWLPHLDAAGRADALALWRADPDGWYRRYTRGEAGFEEQRMARANQLHERFGGPPLDDAGYAAWRDVFWTAFVDGWTALPDAVPFLDRLEAAGIVYGALTNAGTAQQTQKLARAGLARVPVLVTVDTLGFGKPDPRVFLEGARRLGTAPAATLYAGDEADVDAGAAIRAGLRGAWLDRPGRRRGGPHLEDPQAVRAAGGLVVPDLLALADALGV